MCEESCYRERTSIFDLDPSEVMKGHMVKIKVQMVNDGELSKCLAQELRIAKYKCRSICRSEVMGMVQDWGQTEKNGLTEQSRDKCTGKQTHGQTKRKKTFFKSFDLRVKSIKVCLFT